MKRMLFNATHSEELRVAIVDGQKLIDLDIEHAGKEQRKSNIYKAVITRVEPSLEAVFVDYGAERHGFLPFKEIARSYLQNEDGDFSRNKIASLLKEGQQLIVQVEKDERGNKGAALTSYVSLAGRYLVLMPNNPKGGGVSRRVEGDERAELKDVLNQLEIPQGMSLIARTAGIGRSVEELQWDLNYLLHLWQAIESASNAQEGAFLIYQEGSLVIRAIRDLFQPDIGEILIDTESIYEQAKQFMGHVMPSNVNKVKFYSDDVPLFSRFQIEHQIETAYRRDVNLPSGGAIVIDYTEALVSIDVNSARSTRGGDIETTALNTNLEAADEIARQLRLRDLGGLIVIDFIDMENTRNQREVENRLREALRYDRARVQTGKISRFGLLELSRQRLQPSLGESSHTPCPRCHGTGFIRDTESSALHILRILQEEAMKDNTAIVRAQVPVDVATFLLNEKRADVYSIEARLKVHVVLIPNTHLETPNYQVIRIRHDEANQMDLSEPSYQLAEIPEPTQDVKYNGNNDSKPVKLEAAVKGVTPTQPAPLETKQPPKPSVSEKTSLISTIIGWFKKAEPVVEEPQKRIQRDGRSGEYRQNDRRRRGNGNNNRNRQNQKSTERVSREETPVIEKEQSNQRVNNQVTGAETSVAKPQQSAPNPRRRQTRSEVPVNTKNETNVSEAASVTTTTPAVEEKEGSQRQRRNRRGNRRDRYSSNRRFNGAISPIFDRGEKSVIEHEMTESTVNSSIELQSTTTNKEPLAEVRVATTTTSADIKPQQSFDSSIAPISEQKQSYSTDTVSVPATSLANKPLSISLNSELILVETKSPTTLEPRHLDAVKRTPIRTPKVQSAGGSDNNLPLIQIETIK